jgi:Tfp pilus assembly protein PilX
MPRNSRRRRGAALMAALMVMVITSMFVGAGLLLALTDYDLSWAQTRSEASQRTELHRGSGRKH